MADKPEDALPTRASLLKRVKNWEDQASWQEFYQTYRRLIQGLAEKSGLTKAEAEDVVQETMVEVAHKMPTFEYNPERGSFKTWLFQLARWRILDQLRKRARQKIAHFPHEHDTSSTRTVEKIPDPASLELEKLYEHEWQQNLLQTAVELIRKRVDPEKFQIFDLLVNKQWSQDQVSNAFNIPAPKIYLVKHRISKMIEAQVRRLEKKMG